MRQIDVVQCQIDSNSRRRRKGKTDLAYTYGKRSRNQYTFKRFATPPNPLADLSAFDRM